MTVIRWLRDAQRRPLTGWWVARDLRKLHVTAGKDEPVYDVHGKIVTL